MTSGNYETAGRQERCKHRPPGRTRTSVAQDMAAGGRKCPPSADAWQCKVASRHRTCHSPPRTSIDAPDLSQIYVEKYISLLMRESTSSLTMPTRVTVFHLHGQSIHHIDTA